MIYLFGTGGHAKVVYGAILMHGKNSEQVSFVDEKLERVGGSFREHEILGPGIPDDLADNGFHVAIGDNTSRQNLALRCLEKNGRFVAVCSPSAMIDNTACIQEGSFIACGAVVSADAEVGAGSIVNHNCVVDHDCKMGRFSHIAPGAILGGNVVVGDRTLVGAGAVVLPGIEVGSDVIVGAGSVVTKHVPNRAIWIGASQAS
ncbi:acetyltransferase [Maritalea sp. S77]|uniref:acetyltransferase n=1 Tax=Maritalea sp. S77 TaxID=3415125 RepID=UPI003C7E6AC6